MGLREYIACAVSVRLSALLALPVVIYVLAAGMEIDATTSAFVLTMTSFTWHASLQLAWFRGR